MNTPVSNVRYNYGIALLKVAACFGVVCLHFGKNARWATVAVPLFMFVAAYLGARTVGVGSLWPRIKRLYVPFAAWGLVYYVLYSAAERRVDLACLFTQLTIGAPACPPLYFMSLLMASTAVVGLVGKLRSLRMQFAVLLLATSLCFALQYAGVNAHLFGGLPVSTGAALGRFVELLPAALAGYAAFRLASRRGLLLAVALAAGTLYALQVCAGVSLSAPGFCYQGIGLYCLTIGVALFAILLGGGGGAWRDGRGLSVIKVGASLTAGIYYVHLLVGKVLEALVGRHRGAWEACVVFALSALLVLLMKRSRRLVWMVL